MPDQQSEQDPLTDVLGFNPNEPSKPDLPLSIRARQADRRHLPEDWKDQFRREVGDDTLVCDPDNLLTVSEFSMRKIDGTRGSKVINRSYFVYDPEEGFVQQTFLYLPEDLETGDVRLFTTGDNREDVSLEFNKTNLDTGEFAPIEIKRRGVGHRSLKISCNESGNVESIILTVANDSNHYDSDMVEVIRDFHEIFCYKNLEGKWVVGGERGLLGELEFEQLVEENKMILKRVDRGEVKDEMEIPLKIDPKKLLDVLVPEALRKNPADSNPQLDNEWRGADFFHIAGFRWDAVADDRFHSLTRIPQPASSE